MKEILYNKNGLRSVGVVLFVCFMAVASLKATTITASGGNWSATGTWVGGVVPTSSDDVVIPNAISVAIDVAVTINATLTVQGTGTNTGGSVTISGGSLTIGATGTFIMARDGGTFPATTWNDGATAKITGTTVTIPTGLSTQSIYHLTFDCPSYGASNLSLVLVASTGGSYTIRGNVNIYNTGSLAGAIRLLNFSSNDTKTLTINGDLNVTPNSSNPATYQTTGSGANATTYLNLSILGNLNVEAGSTSGANASCSISASGAITTTFNLGGNLKVVGSSATQTATLTKSTGLVTFNFNKVGTQTFTKSATNSTMSGAVAYVVKNNATLDLGTSIFANSISGTSFTVEAGGGLKIGDPNGIISNNAASGNVQITNATSTRTYTTGSNYEYTGSAAQVTGSGLPATVNNLTINNSSNVTLTNAVNVKGNLILTAGNLTGNTVTLNGSSNQNISGNGNTIGALTLNNASGATLTSATTVSGALTFTSGKVTLGANTLTVGSISGASSSNYVVTNGAGALKILAVSGATTFPIGSSSSSYDPAVLTPTTTSDIAVKVSSSFANMVLDAMKVTPREWNITPTTLSSTTFALTHDAAAIVPSGTAVIGHYTSGAWNTTDVTGAAYNSGTRTYSGTCASFSPFGGGVPGGFNAVLSVELANFKAKSSNQTNLLSWSTATERNNQHFNIERSANGSNFTSIGTVKGSGTTTSANNYTFTDETPLSISYYRLQSVDFDGKIQASNVVTVFRSASGKLKVYPTVASDKLTIVLDNTDTQTFSISDLMGRSVQTGQLNGQKELSISTLAVGTYVLKVGSEVVKFVKN